MRLLLSRWFLAGLLISVLGGCRLADHSLTNSGQKTNSSPIRAVPTPAVPTPTVQSVPAPSPRPMAQTAPAQRTVAPATPRPTPVAPVAQVAHTPPCWSPVRVEPRPRVEQVEYRRPEGALLGHAPDYRWLVGHLERAGNDHWYIRYADAGQNDVYGGRFELFGTGPMTGFHEGQLVRAEGSLVDPAPLEIQPAYHIRALQAVPR